MKLKRLIMLLLVLALSFLTIFTIFGIKGDVLLDNLLEIVLDKQEIVVENTNSKKKSIINNDSVQKDVEVSKNNINENIVQPVFLYGELSEEYINKITGVSWKPDAPVKIEDLRLAKVTYWGFDDKTHVGELIVHKNVAKEVVEIFKELYEAKFPIEKIRLIDEYGGNDNLSMEDNNTSSFCYRSVPGTNRLSKHSYGIAIDINPVQNPYIKGNEVLPEKGKEYLNRSNVKKGMIIKGDVCHNAFKRRGWIWGGEWKTLKDYQHFEKKIDVSN